jgi:hypothetical protein
MEIVLSIVQWRVHVGWPVSALHVAVPVTVTLPPFAA